MRGFEKLRNPGDLRLLRLQPLANAAASIKPQPLGQRRQPAVGVVGPQQQAVLRPAGEHAIRLVDAARDQVVDHHADVGLIAAAAPAALAPRSASAAFAPAMSPWAAASS